MGVLGILALAVLLCSPAKILAAERSNRTSAVAQDRSDTGEVDNNGKYVVDVHARGYEKTYEQYKTTRQGKSPSRRRRPKKPKTTTTPSPPQYEEQGLTAYGEGLPGYEEYFKSPYVGNVGKVFDQKDINDYYMKGEEDYGKLVEGVQQYYEGARDPNYHSQYQQQSDEEDEYKTIASFDKKDDGGFKPMKPTTTTTWGNKGTVWDEKEATANWGNKDPGTTTITSWGNREPPPGTTTTTTTTMTTAWGQKDPSSGVSSSSSWGHKDPSPPAVSSSSSWRHKDPSPPAVSSSSWGHKDPSEGTTTTTWGGNKDEAWSHKDPSENSWGSTKGYDRQKESYSYSSTEWNAETPKQKTRKPTKTKSQYFGKYEDSSSEGLPPAGKTQYFGKYEDVGPTANPVKNYDSLFPVKSYASSYNFDTRPFPEIQPTKYAVPAPYDDFPGSSIPNKDYVSEFDFKGNPIETYSAGFPASSSTPSFGKVPGGGGFGGGSYPRDIIKSFYDYNQQMDSSFAASTQQQTYASAYNYNPMDSFKRLNKDQRYAGSNQNGVSHPIIVPVPQPYPVKVPIAKPVAVPIIKEIKVPVEKLVPYPVIKNVPYPVEKPVPVPVEKKVAVPVEKPYPVKIPIIKNVYHHAEGDDHDHVHDEFGHVHSSHGHGHEHDHDHDHHDHHHHQHSHESSHHRGRNKNTKNHQKKKSRPHRSNHSHGHGGNHGHSRGKSHGHGHGHRTRQSQRGRIRERRMH